MYWNGYIHGTWCSVLGVLDYRISELGVRTNSLPHGVEALVSLGFAMMDMLNAILDKEPVQEYFLPFLEGQIELMKPGQFVYENDGPMVAGFISIVYEHGYQVCLFDALWRTELPSRAILCCGQKDMDWVAQRLDFALKQNPAMRPYWVAAINESATK